jgi:2-methylisocitrate lyase-like PEP mutase family enzyme
VTTSTRERARTLAALHRASTPLLLPNAWDVASARAVVAAGLPAVATTSAGVAEALGSADGEALPVDDAFAAIARIARAVDFPVTADLESGYGLAADELVERLLDAGAVGLNLEDSDPASGARRPPSDQAERLAAVAAAARRSGVELVINARIDTCLPGGTADPAERAADLLARAAAYREAGASCVYPIFLADEETIAALVSSGGPVNILLQPAGPGIDALGRLGVARISLGVGLLRAASRYLERALAHLRAGEADWAAGR